MVSGTRIRRVGPVTIQTLRSRVAGPQLCGRADASSAWFSEKSAPCDSDASAPPSRPRRARARPVHRERRGGRRLVTTQAAFLGVAGGAPGSFFRAGSPWRRRRSGPRDWPEALSSAVIARDRASGSSASIACTSGALTWHPRRSRGMAGGTGGRDLAPPARACLPWPCSMKPGAWCEAGAGKRATRSRVRLTARTNGTWQVTHALSGASRCRPSLHGSRDSSSPRPADLHRVGARFSVAGPTLQA